MLDRVTDPPRSARASLAEIAAARGIRDLRLLQAMREVPRARFVPRRHARLAQEDVPIPIGHEQVTTQPSLVAAMVEALALEGQETVLEVGTGHGYQTALLARLARRVWSVERWPDLAETARANLAAVGTANAEVVTGDGTQGLPEQAPFDAVVVAAAFPEVPPPLVEQLVPGGRLVHPVGHGGNEEVVLFVKEAGSLRPVRLVTYARFVPLVGAHGFPIRGRTEERVEE